MGDLKRNVSLYPWYAGLFHAYFWLPVFFLYFTGRFSLEDALRLEAIYYVSVVVVEVPSGYLSDVVGRRVTLLLAAVMMSVAYALFYFGDSFTYFAAAQICLAIGFGSNSGTDVSFHYDSLAGLGREEEFAAREARVSRIGFLSGAVAALIGGAVATWGLGFAYGLSLITSLGAVVVVLMMGEPADPGRAAAPGFIGQLGACVGHTRQPALRWLLAFAILMTALNHIPYEFYQPYIELLSVGFPEARGSTPLVLGLHTALTMLLGSWAAGRSIAWRDRVGIGPALLSATVMQVLIIAVMGWVLSPVVIVLILCRSMPRGVMTAPMNAAIAPRVPQRQRATYLSIQSLAGRLAFAGLLFALSHLAADDAEPDWPSISHMLAMCALIGGVGLVFLAAAVRPWLNATGDSASAGPGRPGDAADGRG